MESCLQAMLIKASPWCHNNKAVDILPTRVTQSTYLKCSGIQHSPKDSTEFLRSDSEPVSTYVWPRETQCLFRAIRCSHVPSEELLRASWRHQAWRYIWTTTCLLAWSSQKLADTAEKPLLNIGWRFWLEVHEMYTAWLSIHLKERWCRPIQEL